MPCILKARVVAARDLPVMDKATELTDAYVELRLGEHELKRTGICRKTLNPVWNEDFRFEVSDDAELQNEPLEVKVLDYDAISSNDAVGVVYIDLNPLLAWDVRALRDGGGGSTALSASQGETTAVSGEDRAISGYTLVLPSVPLPLFLFWFPLYDTLRGIRGEVNVQIKLQFFGDVNPFKESSAGVQIYGTSALPMPPGYRVAEVFGFVDVLLNEDDPEYHWSDSFRTPRYSNESRQKLLYRMSGNLRRRLGREAIELGGNAVIGFRQCFDLENKEYCITARAVGTCVQLVPVSMLQSQTSPMESDPMLAGEGALAGSYHSGSGGQSSPTGFRAMPLATGTSSMAMTMEDAEPHPASTEDGSSPMQPANVEPSAAVTERVPSSFIPLSLVRNNSTIGSGHQLHYRNPNEQHLITLKKLPEGVVLHLGGIVSARSVKLLQNDDTEVREQWWMEIREEIKSHARALSCPVVIGYTESTTIQDELCVLSAMGTAARLDFRFFTGHLNYVSSGGMARVPDDLATMMGAASLGGRMDMTTSRMAVDVPGEQPTTSFDEATAVETVAATASSTAVATQPSAKTGSYSKDGGSLEKYIRRIRAHKGRASCQACHIPYHRQRAPFPMNFMRCNCCRKRYVPEILITNVEPLPELETIGQGYYLEAHICRPKKRKDGESNATIVSDTLPFIEYDIHRQLLYKLRIQGLNAIFGLQVQLTIGESLIIAVASGTATYLSALPAPPPLRITRNLDIIDAEDRQLYEIQRRIMERSEENRTRIEASRAARLELQSTVASASGSFMNTTGLGGGGLATVGNDGGLIQTVIPEHGPFQGSVASLPRRPSWPHKDDDTSTVATPLESSMSSPAGAQRSATALRRPFASGIGAPGYTAGDESDSDSTVASEDGAEASGQQFTSMVVQVDDDADEDLMAVLLDPQYPDVFLMCNTETLPIQAAGAGGTMTKMSELNNLLMPGGSRLRSNQQASTALFNAQMITVVKEGRISTISHHHNRQLAAILRDLYKELHVSLSSYLNCSLVAGIQQNIQLSDDDELQVRLNAMVIGQHMTEGERQAVKDGATEDAAASSESVTFVPFEDQEDPVLVQLEQQRQQQRKLTHTYSQSAMSQQPDADNEAGTVSTVPVPRQPSFATRLSQVFGGKSASVPRSISGGILGMVQSTRTSSASLGRNVATADAGRVGASSSSVNASKISVSTPIPIAPSPADEIAAPPADPTTAESQPSSFVEITPLTHVPGGTIINYLGHMSLHFVKEDLNLHHHHGNHYTESMHHYADAVLDDGLGTFIHKFLVEIQAIARAHTRAVGGNALVSFNIQHTLFRETLKNQAYGLLSVSGDMVEVRYDDADAQLVTGEEMVKHLWEQAEACVATVNAARRAV